MRPTRFKEADRGERSYFVTAVTSDRRRAFQTDGMARLFLDVLGHYRDQRAYLLHDFTLMPDHVHLILTPREQALARCLQFIKGGFSYRVSRELGSKREVWQRGFADHRLRDAEDYLRHRRYIHENAVRKGLVTAAGEYPFCSLSAGVPLDAIPEYLRG